MLGSFLVLRKLFSHAGSFLFMLEVMRSFIVMPKLLVMLDEFYLCGQHWKMQESTMKTCGHVIKKKKQAGGTFVMWAGLRNNEFCLRGLKGRETIDMGKLAQLRFTQPLKLFSF